MFAIDLMPGWGAVLFIILGIFAVRRLFNKVDDDGAIKNAAKEAAKEAAKKGIAHVADRLFKKR